MKKISTKDAQTFLNEVKALPEGTMLVVIDGDLTVILDERTGIPSKAFDIMDDVREMSQRPVIAALRDLLAVVQLTVDISQNELMTEAVRLAHKQLEEGFGIAEPL